MKILLLVSLIILFLYILPRYKKPKVIKGFITDEERSYIIRSAEGKLEESRVTQGKIVDVTVRKSKTAWLSKDDPIVNGVIQRCIKYTDRPISNCEKLQVLKYENDGHYKPHQDCFVDDTNKRLYTFILALNDDYEGGETYFPILGEKYKLHAGDALFFNTLDTYENITSKALHGGLPVKSGEKWVCNLWIRKDSYLG